MFTKNFGLLASSTLLLCAVGSHGATAADISGSDTRNWGGIWIGVGAGYGHQNGSGTSAADGCFTGTSATGQGVAIASCNASPGGINVGGGAADRDGDATAAAAGAATGSSIPDTALALAAAAAAGSGDGASASTTANTSVVNDSPPVANASAAANANGTPNFTGAGTGTAVPPANGDIVIPLSSNSNVPGANSTTWVAGNFESGALIAYSEQSASSQFGDASAFAFGFSGLSPESLDADGQSFSPSVHLRADHQLDNNFVIGAELEANFMVGDGEFSDQSRTQFFEGDNSASISQSVAFDVNALASARLRLGYAHGDFMVYATGGLAYADLDATSSIRGTGSSPMAEGFDVDFDDSKSAHAFGGVVGGGVSAFITDNTVLSVEGLYYRFGEEIDFDNGMSAEFDDAYSVSMKLSFRPWQ